MLVQEILLEFLRTFLQEFVHRFFQEFPLGCLLFLLQEFFFNFQELLLRFFLRFLLEYFFIYDFSSSSMWDSSRTFLGVSFRSSFLWRLQEFHLGFLLSKAQGFPSWMPLRVSSESPPLNSFRSFFLCCPRSFFWEFFRNSPRSFS